MPWWSSHSAETGRDDYEAMRRRFVEASRRAEIIAMVNEATSEQLSAQSCVRRSRPRSASS
jgi:hypothetical protein